MSGSPHKHEESRLRTEPSFCIYSVDDKFGGERDNEDLIREKLMENRGKFDRSVATGKSIETQFSFGRNAMQMVKEDDSENEELSPSRFNDLKIEIRDESTNDSSYADDSGDPDKYYHTIIRENPSNPMVLRNYAQYLESKGDLFGAEEYYFHATLADPKDAEILSRYAKLVWELHRDHKRALSFFERAVQAAPEDSHVHAAYASFLWEIDEDEEENDSLNTQAENADNRIMDLEDEKRPASPPLHLAMGLGIDTIGYNSFTDYFNTTCSNESSTVEEYYRKMVEENPCNPLFLRDYAHYLHQSKGDLRGAKDYYSRAILLDPSDGQVLSLYGNLVWQLHGNKDRAVSYFERAVQACPNDSIFFFGLSNILGSYAKFLWEVDDEKDYVIKEASS